MKNWLKRNWQYWIRKENHKHIWQHLAGNLISIPVTILLIKNPIHAIIWMAFFFGVTVGWEFVQAWGKWKDWWNYRVIDTFMDILSPNLIPFLIILDAIK
jgi:hypothetical protein